MQAAPQKSSATIRVAFFVGLAVSLLAGAGAAVWVGLSGNRGPFEELDEATQREIWDAEHVTFEIETHFGKPLAEALRTGDRTAALRGLHDDFRGTMPVGGSETKLARAGVTERRIEASAAAAELGRDEWGDALFAQLQGLAIDAARLRVLNIRRDKDSADRWSARLLLTAQGNDGGMRVRWSATGEAAFRFADDDAIRAGGIAARWEFESVRRATSPRTLMEEVTESMGLDRLSIPDNWKLSPDDATSYRFQFAVEDFDRDGWLDIAVATKRQRPTLLRSQGGSGFEDVTRALGVTGEAGDNDVYLACWLDYDNDGFPDLVLGDRLYHNERGERFIDVTADSRLRFGHSPKGCTVADYDNDGRLDLYVLYDLPDKRPEGKVGWVGDGRSGGDNLLWRNLGSGRFKNVTYLADADGGPRRSHAAAWLHLNEDRHPDLYVVNDFGPNVMLKNRGNGTFEDVTAAIGAGDFATSMGVAAGDLDNDGKPELYVANMYSKMGRRIIDYVGADHYPQGVYQQIQGSCAGNRLYRLSAGGPPLEELSERLEVNAVGWAYAPAMADFDGDGQLDIYATTGYLSFSRRKPDG